MSLTPRETRELARLENIYEARGGKAAELAAERIDALRAKRDDGTREAALILTDLSDLIVGHEDEYPHGAVEALDVAIRALNPTEGLGYPIPVTYERENS